MTDVLALAGATFAGLPEVDRLVLASCATPVGYADGEHLFHEGSIAETFFLIEDGAVALEVFVPDRGTVVVETLRAGDVVGWAWLFPPYRWHFDARAVGELHALAFDAACVRRRMGDDTAFGLELMRRFAELVVERLTATRLRLLDVHGGHGAD